MTAGNSARTLRPVVDEPVRGGFPDRSFYSLSGLDQMRAWLRGQAPRAPLSHLTGIRPTQVGPGSVTETMPTSPALQTFDGNIEGLILLQDTLEAAVLTTAPAAHEVRTAVFAVESLRPGSVESEVFVVKARVLNSGPTFTLAEAFLEDGLGRGVAHATGTFVICRMEPPPPSWTGSLEPQEPPRYATPDPYLRPVPSTVFQPGDDVTEFFRDVASGARAPSPVHRLLRFRIVEVSEGRLCVTVPATEWLCGRIKEISPGVIAYLANTAHGAVATLMPKSHRLGILYQTVSFLRPVTPDGKELVARGRVTHQGEEFLTSHVEVSDGAGNTVAVGSQTSLFISHRRPSDRQPNRLLATVLFTDIVGSTTEAERLGDARWQELLDEHHRIVRKQLEVFKGREVKTTGDGFLVTFESPGQAVQAARAIRDAVGRLGLQIRAGLHTGECEVSDTDVVGIAVHIASRVQCLAAPGEILVSGTVRDLVTGSGLRFEDRGRQPLKGIEGDWSIFAVAEET